MGHDGRCHGPRPLSCSGGRPSTGREFDGNDVLRPHRRYPGWTDGREAKLTEPDLVIALDLDCRGMNCPLPILKTKKAITGLATGDVLRVVSTDPGSIADMAAFSRRTGNEIIEQSEGAGEYTFLFRKG